MCLLEDLESPVWLLSGFPGTGLVCDVGEDGARKRSPEAGL